MKGKKTGIPGALPAAAALAGILWILCHTALAGPGEKAPGEAPGAGETREGTESAVPQTWLGKLFGEGAAVPAPSGAGYGFRRPEPGDMRLLERYRELNGSVEAILRIPGTVLDHPVVQTPWNEEYYLNRDLLGNPNSHGVPFLSAGSRLEAEGENIVIYGHNIWRRTRDVFCDLAGYEELDFYKEHPLVETVSSGGLRRWLIFAYFLTDTGEEDTFRYSDVTGFPTRQSFEDYLKEVEKRNFLEVDVPLAYGDTLLTLSSCSRELSGSGTNRMVVMARLLGGDEDWEKIAESARMAPCPLLPARLGKNLK